MSDEKQFDIGDLEVSERILLARIDERLKSVESKLYQIETKLISTSEHQSVLRSIKEHETRLDEIHDWRTSIKSQFVVYSFVAITISGIVVSVITDFIRNKLL